MSSAFKSEFVVLKGLLKNIDPKQHAPDPNSYPACDVSIQVFAILEKKLLGHDHSDPDPFQTVSSRPNPLSKPFTVSSMPGKPAPGVKALHPLGPYFF